MTLVIIIIYITIKKGIFTSSLQHGQYGLTISGNVGEMIAAGKYYPRGKDTQVSDVVGIYLVPEEQKLESAVRMLEELKPGQHGGTAKPGNLTWPSGHRSRIVDCEC